MNETEEEEKLLRVIDRKISSITTLNGGLDKLTGDINVIKLSQQKMEKDIGEISKSLFSPKEGLFSKMQAAEHSISALAEQYRLHFKNDERAHEEVETALENLHKGREQICQDVNAIKINLEEQTKHIGKLNQTVVDFRDEYETDMEITKKKVEVSEVTSTRLKDLAGKDLDQLKNIMTLQEQFMKLFWAAAGLVLFAFAKFVWELFKR